MPDHKVKQGDCIYSIAQKYGFLWEKIWNHPNNAQLKERRKDPNILYPGDVVFIPEKEEKQESCATGQTHRFRKKGTPEQLRIVLKNEEGEPLANVSYILTIDGENRNGTTDSEGLVSESIRPDARVGRLIVFDEESNQQAEYELALGYLDPITEVTGVQMRLSNLGFDCGGEDGKIGPRTQEANEAFQREYDLEATGKLNDATRQKLQEVYGS